MKKLRFSTGVLVLLIMTTVCFSQKSNTETLTVPLSSPGKAYSLKVNLLAGSITVTGYEGKEIIINATPGKEEEDEVFDKPDKKGMKKISAGGGFEVTAKEADNNVVVNAGMNKVDLELKVPQGVNLKLGTVNDGHVSVNDVKGEIEVNNVDDDIELNNISGSAVANAVSGNVTVTFTSVDSQASMGFSSVSGDINISFPGETKANLKLKSDMGDIYSDFDIDIDKTVKTEKAVHQDEPGMYKIRKDDWIYGKINGGGPEMIFKTMSGDINIKKAAK